MKFSRLIDYFDEKVGNIVSWLMSVMIIVVTEAAIVRSTLV